ncbi:MAG: matrixin family metalloprotease [Deltaproteobacteria bacterium]|nr:matrixin family metalloprotease [Deltaproteobacteria bacterium]
MNWTSFVDQGIPSSYQTALENALQETIERWKQVSGANIRPTYGGTTTATSGGAQEIVVIMLGTDPQGGSGILARSNGNLHRIEFYRRFSTGQNIPWIFGWPTDPDPQYGYEIQAVAMHEYGHMLGLERHSDTGRATMGQGCSGSYVWVNSRLGPNTDDITRLRNLYGVFTGFRVGTRRSTDNGLTWAYIYNGLKADSTVTTTIEPGAVRDSGSVWVLAFSNPNKNVEFIVSGSEGFDSIIRRATIAGMTSMYGVSIGGEDGEWMVAAVDPSLDDMRIRVKYTNNSGQTWSSRDPPLTDIDGAQRRSLGTPSVVRSASNTNTWYLAYPVLDTQYPDRTGWVIALKSTNDGVTWATEWPAYTAEEMSTGTGVSVAHLPSATDVPVALSRTTYNSDKYTQYAVRFSSQTLDPLTGIASSTLQSMMRPSLGRNNAGYVYLAVTKKGTNELITSRRSSGDTDWLTNVSAGVYPSVGPAVAADKNLANIYIYYFY